MKLFEGERLWRMLSDFWSFLVLAFVVLNFATKSHYDYLIVPLCILYTGILTLYVGTKEFDRWYENHRERHPGEWFVILWTVVVVGLVVASIILGPEYRVGSDVMAVYIAVLSIFIITQKSKKLHREQMREEHLIARQEAEQEGKSGARKTG